MTIIEYKIFFLVMSIILTNNIFINYTCNLYKLNKDFLKEFRKTNQSPGLKMSPGFSEDRNDVQAQHVQVRCPVSKEILVHCSFSRGGISYPYFRAFSSFHKVVHTFSIPCYLDIL